MKASIFSSSFITTSTWSRDAELLRTLQADFAFGWCGEEETLREIGERYRAGYLIDTHTAVAAAVLESCRRENGERKPAVVVSTASPYKFCDSVLRAVGSQAQGSGTKLIETLSRVTGTPVPPPLAGLDKRPVRFDRTVEKTEMPRAVLEMLGIG